MSRQSRGFTVIEVVVTLVLVGMVAAVTLSRLLGADTYNPAAAQAQVVSVLRSAQQHALGRSDVSATLELQTDQLVLLVREGATETQRSTARLESITLSGDVNGLDSCAITPGSDAITASDAMVLEFNALGDLRRGGIENSTGYPVDITTGARICVNNDPRYSVCVSKAGYAYAGDCDD